MSWGRRTYLSLDELLDADISTFSKCFVLLNRNIMPEQCLRYLAFHWVSYKLVQEYLCGNPVNPYWWSALSVIVKNLKDKGSLKDLKIMREYLDDIEGYLSLVGRAVYALLHKNSGTAAREVAVYSKHFTWKAFTDLDQKITREEIFKAQLAAICVMLEWLEKNGYSCGIKI